MPRPPGCLTPALAKRLLAAHETRQAALALRLQAWAPRALGLKGICQAPPGADPNAIQACLWQPVPADPQQQEAGGGGPPERFRIIF